MITTCTDTASDAYGRLGVVGACKPGCPCALESGLSAYGAQEYQRATQRGTIAGWSRSGWLLLGSDT